MTRYTGWRRLSGDTADRPDLLDLGKKLLGQLEVQRRTPGVRTCAIERHLPDGSIVRARFIGDLPEIHVQDGAATRPPAPFYTLMGFVVRPSPDSGQRLNADLNHVLLAFNGATGWAPGFYDAAHLPEPPPDAARLYGTAFPDGLLRQGNVDWRGAQERLVVSWMGPSCRYFRRYAPEQPYVFYAGRVLVDLSVFEFDLLGDTGFAVIGACLKGRHLLVVAAKGEAPTAREVLLSIPVRAPADEAGIPPQIGAPTRLDPDYSSAEKLGEWLRVHGTAWEEHPWYFNQSGTEARTLRQDSAGPVMEYVLGFDAAGELVLSQLTHPIAQDVTEVTEQTIQAFYNRFHDQNVQDVGPGAWGVVDRWTSSTFFHTPPGVESVTVVTHSFSKTNDGPERVPVAVDYRDNVPVYAEAYLRRRVETLSYSKAAAGECEVTVTAFDGSPYPDPFTWSRAVTFAFSGSSSYHRVRTEQRGLWTDFLDLPATQVLTDDWTGSSSEGGSSAGGTFVGGDGTDTMVQLGSPVASVSIAGNQSVDTAEDALYIVALDLRSRAIAYVRRSLESLEVQTWAAEDAQPASESLAEPSGGIVSVAARTVDITHTTTLTSEVNLDYRVVAEGEEVFAEAIAYSSSSSGPTPAIQTFDQTAAMNTYGATIGQWGWYIPLLASANFQGLAGGDWLGGLDEDPVAPHPPAPASATTLDPVAVDYTDDVLETPQPHGTLLLDGGFARPMDHYTLLGAFGGHGDLQTLAKRWCFCIPVLQPAGDVPAVAYHAYAGLPTPDGPVNTAISTLTGTATVRYDPVWVIGRTARRIP